MDSSECWILCCQCGTPIQPNSANVCVPCLRNRVDITEGLPRQISIQSCRSCERYFQPPTQWLTCSLESKELLSLCLKRLKLSGHGPDSIRLVDAGFLWTEPHSKRLKLKISIQKQVLTNTILQQTYGVEVIICNQQCPDCAKVMAKNTWKALVQVRQKTLHQRTFLFLEQLILKHSAHIDCTNIKKVSQGLDFYFLQRTHALKFVDFLNSVSPIRTKTSEQLLSKDVHSGTSNYKFTFSVDLLPICKDDILCLPPKLAKSSGGISSLVIVLKVGYSVHLMDPVTLKTLEISAAEFWHAQVSSLFSFNDLKPFIVLDTSIIDSNSKYSLAEVEIARESDLGKNDQTFFVKTHLGNIIKPGDQVFGYDLKTTNLNNEDFSKIEKNVLQDIFLIKKASSKPSKNRNWKLKYLEKEDMIVESEEKRPSSKKTKLIQKVEDVEMELFMQDIEEDKELRSQFLLYKNIKKGDDPTISKSRFDILFDHDESKDSQVHTSNIDITELLDDLSLGETNDN